MTDKTTNSGASILRAFTTGQILIEIIDDLKECPIYVRDLKHKTNVFHKYLESYISRNMGMIFKADLETAGNLLLLMQQASDKLAGMSVEQLYDFVHLEKEN